VFGTITPDLIHPILLLAPTRKSLETDPGPPDGLGLDHFQCYHVKNAQTRRHDVQVTDQFGTLTVAVKRPYRVCVPADKNGEGIVDGDQGLTCYRLRPAHRPRFAGRAPVFVHDQFGLREIAIKRAVELCLPSTIGGS
jgi:hypothetical protein